MLQSFSDEMAKLDTVFTRASNGKSWSTMTVPFAASLPIRIARASRMAIQFPPIMKRTRICWWNQPTTTSTCNCHIASRRWCPSSNQIFASFTRTWQATFMPPVPRVLTASALTQGWNVTNSVPRKYSKPYIREEMRSGVTCSKLTLSSGITASWISSGSHKKAGW